MVKVFSLPMVIDDGRLDWAISLLNESRSISNTREEIRLNWSSVKEISPAGMAILSCLFDTFLEQKNRIICVSVPKKFKQIPVVNNLTNIKNFDALPLPNIQNFENADLILKGNIAIDVLFQERFKEKFAETLTDDLIYDCLLILNELMQNTCDHSTAERYYLYMGIWGNEFHAGVLDMGISIPAKMEQKYSSDDDIGYLKLALKEGTTTRRIRSGGVGLAYFFHYLKRNEGKLTILSRKAQVRRYFKTRRSQINLLKYPLYGSWCFARFPVRRRHDLN
jgi:ABC-type transporter Mla MlaB component/anti-sigma regulatory factor (Ser/Thr protein kinase)